MRPDLRTAAACIALAAGLSSPAEAQMLRSSVVASGFIRPLQVVAPPGDPDRLFVVEQHTGDIKIIDQGVVLPTPFLTVRNLATLNEQGLLGLVFHPDFVNNGIFFVNYTVTGGGNRIEKYTVSAPALDTDVANPTGDVILSYSNPFTAHNAGMLAFGDDGYLYIGTGDGGINIQIGDPGDRAQNVNEIHGKMLRIDVDGDDFPMDSLRDYAIPPGQPAFGGLPELYMIGLRNPWRYSFDRMNGDMWIGDVGQVTLEEINLSVGGVGGQNWGWRCREGTGCYGGSAFCTCMGAGLTDPIYEFQWFEGSAVIGGYAYRGPEPCFQGHYIFGASGAGRIWSLEPDGMGGVTATERTSELGIEGTLALTSFGEDNDGNLYICDFISGEVHKIQVICGDPGLESCNGDGGDQMGCTDCPCTNNADVGTLGGCLNSVGDSARLIGSGVPSLTADTLNFALVGAPPGAFCVLQSGANIAPANMANPCFGIDSGVQSTLFDGLRCVVQDTKRHGGRGADGNGRVGYASNGWGPPAGPAGGIAGQAGFVAGQVRHFQVTHREDAMLSCMRGLNTSQSVTYTFLP